MSGTFDKVAGVLANILLCTVCLRSAIQTFQINRGAAAGFLLQALEPFLEAAAPLATSLGLDLDARTMDDAWPCAVAGLPLLVFGFYWLNGDHTTANSLLGGALLLAVGADYFTEEGKAMVAHSVTTLASVTLLIISVLTGNAYGVVGSLLVGTAGLLAGTQRDLIRCLMAAGNLTLQWALQAQHQQLDQED